MDEEVAGIYAREAEFLDRFVQIGVAGGRVVSVSFPATPEDETGEDHPLLDQVFAYLEGEADDFRDVDVALTVPTDRRRVLDALRQVGYGDQISVEDLVRLTPGLDGDDEDASQLIRSALADNPVPLFVPDHRVRDGPSGAPPEVEQRLRSLEGL